MPSARDDFPIQPGPLVFAFIDHLACKIVAQRNVDVDPRAGLDVDVVLRWRIRVDSGTLATVVQPEDRNPIHALAVGVALGLETPFAFFQEAMLVQPNLGDALFRFASGENDADAEFPTKLVEETAQRVDPSFSLSSSTSERIAMSLLEDECLVLLSGKGTPKRLLKALRQVDRTFGHPSWVGAFFRSIYSLPAATAVATPGFLDELQRLADRLALRRET